MVTSINLKHLQGENAYSRPNQRILLSELALFESATIRYLIFVKYNLFFPDILLQAVLQTISNSGNFLTEISSRIYPVIMR